MAASTLQFPKTKTPDVQAAQEVTEASPSICAERDPETFLWLGMHNYRDNLGALDSVRFRQPAGENSLHLDVGCGPGSFTTEALLPRLRPCRQLVATDKSASMVKYARQHYAVPDVVYHQLDIDLGDVEPLLARYGQFDRVYSFMTFHYVRDLERAYRNVFRLLVDGGEFVTVSFTGTAISDVWKRLCDMPQWKTFVPDPTQLLAEGFCFDGPIPEEQIAANEKAALHAAGLDMLCCSMYDSHWTMADEDAWLDYYVPFFKLDANVPEGMRNDFRNTCRSLLRDASTASPEGCSLRHSVLVVHAQKRR